MLQSNLVLLVEEEFTPMDIRPLFLGDCESDFAGVSRVV